MIRPVMDPISTRPFKLAFEERHLANFYALQRDTKNALSTDFNPVIEDCSSLQFEPHPFMSALCNWVRTYFPDTSTSHTERCAAKVQAIAINALPTDPGFYLFNLAISGEIIADIESEETQKQHEEQRQIRQQESAANSAQRAEMKAVNERLVQEQTEQLMQEIQNLRSQCDTRCDDLKTKNLATVERLEQQNKLREELEQNVNDLQSKHWAKMNEYDIATTQLRDIRNKFEHLNETHRHTQQELTTTKTQFNQARESYHSALSSASNERYNLQQSLSNLQSRYNWLDRRNDELRDDIQRARNSNSGGICVIQ